MTVNPHRESGKSATSAVFSPVSLGTVVVKNRVFVPAHTTNFGLDNLPTDRHLAYHEARARGGAGLIIMESLRVHPTSLGKPQGLGAYDERCVEPLSRIADAVHGHDTKIFGQIIHLGRQIDGDALRLAPWGPSPIAWDAVSVAPHVVNDRDIADLVEGHVISARNVLAAGFDGLEVHVGHGHLLQQFLSPATNERSDGYGGTEDNRMRLAVEVLQSVRDAIGGGVCMGIRVSADEFAPGGLTLQDMARIVPRLAEQTQLDFVNVSHSAYHGAFSLSTQIADMTFAADSFRHLAPRIRASLRQSGHTMPVMAVCKFRSIVEAAEVLEAEGADMIGMARAHIADPFIVSKARLGPVDETRTCIGCNQGCAGFLEKGLPITCVVNPTVGREASWTPNPTGDEAETPKKVLVIGGGPAGLEAAWVAAARGHQVELIDKADQLGGQLRLLHHMPKRRDYVTLVDEQAQACERHGVKMRCNTPFVLDHWAAGDQRPDHIVVATGSRPEAVDFPDGGVGMTLVEALSRQWHQSDRVVMYDLIGDWASLGVVEYLADVGVRVVYVTPVAGYGWKITRYSKTALTARLREAGVAIRPLRSARAFVDGVFVTEDLSTGALDEIRTDHVIAAGNPIAVDELYDKIDALGIEVSLVGDSVSPRSSLEAVYEGHRVGRAL